MKSYFPFEEKGFCRRNDTDFSRNGILIEAIFFNQKSEQVNEIMRRMKFRNDESKLIRIVKSAHGFTLFSKYHRKFYDEVNIFLPVYSGELLLSLCIRILITINYFHLFEYCTFTCI